MNVGCLDMEGVLVPEIWIAFAEASGIPELKRTTRDEPDYNKLMNWRLGVLKEHGLGLKEIQATIATIDPLPGAREFLDALREETRMLREYASQISSEYQAQVDIQQNRVMKLLTIVTTIFLPLSLLVGWYGMNFQGMPELSWTYGYPAVIAVSVLLAVGLIVYFKRKHWF